MMGDRLLEAIGAIGWMALIVAAVDAQLLAREPLHLVLALSATLVSAVFCVALARRPENSRGAPLASVMLAVGLLAVGAFAAARFNETSFSSPLVRRVGIHLSVGGLAVGLYAVHERATLLVRRILDGRLSFRGTMYLLTMVGVAIVSLWVGFTREDGGVGAWRMAPFFLFTMAGLLGGLERPFCRLRTHGGRLAKALVIVAAAGWLALLALAAGYA